MEVFSKYDREEVNNWGDPRLLFLYGDSVYEEIQNTKTFDLESFVSGVGGFIGIFLGYSILQLPELLGLLASFVRNISQANSKGGIFSDMKNGVNVIFTYIKNTLLRYHTVSHSTSHNNPSPKQAWILVSGENENSNPDSIGCISDKTTNVFLSSGGNSESSSRNILGLDDIIEERNSQKDSIEDESLNLSRASVKELVEDIKTQLTIELRNMREENRKETKDMIKENRKEMKSMIEKIRKENQRLDENFKTMFTQKIYRQLQKEDENMKEKTKSQHN